MHGPTRLEDGLARVDGRSHVAVDGRRIPEDRGETLLDQPLGLRTAAWNGPIGSPLGRLDGHHDNGRGPRPAQVDGVKPVDGLPTAIGQTLSPGTGTTADRAVESLFTDSVLQALADRIAARISESFEHGDSDGEDGHGQRRPLVKPDSGPFLARRTDPADAGSDGRDAAVEDILGVGRAIADRTRIRILKILADEPELNVRNLCQRLRQSQPSVSHHLAQMRSVGLVSLRRDGKNNYYCLQPGRLMQFLSALAHLGLFASPPCGDDKAADSEG